MSTEIIFLSLRSCVASYKSETIIVSEKPIYLPFVQYKSRRDQIWPCHKIGQGQPRVIIWTKLVELMRSMLQIKFQGHGSFGSGEEVFLRFLPYMDMVAILVMWTGPFEQTFNPPSQGGCTWNGLNRPSGFRGEDVWNYWQHTHTHTYERTTEAYLY